MSEPSYRRRFGDRKEGRRLRTLPALNLQQPSEPFDEPL